MFPTKHLTDVQQNELMRDLVARQLKNQKLYTNFFVNPNKPAPYVTDKPTSFIEEPLKEECKFLADFCVNDKPPVEKYKYPQTTNMEYGWVQNEDCCNDWSCWDG
ncbi:hypothetical protein HELRODRAFT_184444 [Helobdella robusta]|uniref:Uncharacterized protein n=1 Tax=Helobdella robusta TaxID=6412 RepID=T1FL78_HELRO|nr:hypothetical protein HELRODRAFT_184444 [Helobdella robusta]ESN95871.1 hypothetical protein HELRODRAFT_184444 [Helobdella robusta]